MEQRRMARTWDDVPAPIREDVRQQSDGDLRRVELVDRGAGDYSVVIHALPTGPDPGATAKALGDDDPALLEVLQRARPMRLNDRE